MYYGIVKNDALIHMGKSKLNGAPGPGSGRRPLGSGERPFQHVDKDKWLNQNVKGGKDKPNKSRAEDIMGKAGQGFDNAKNAVSAINKVAQSKKKKADYSNISDDDLRKAINRINLENQYSNLTDSNTSKGLEMTMDILEIAKDLSMTAGAIAGIASSIYMIKKNV